MTRRSMTMTCAALVFVGVVAHAAYRESSTCPVVGQCASIHLKLMRAVDWSREQRDALAEPLRLASH